MTQKTAKSSRKLPTIFIMIIAVTAVTIGDLFMSAAMKGLGPLRIASLQTWWAGQAEFSQVARDCYDLIWTIFSDPRVWLAIGFMLTFMVLWMIALSWSDLTFVMPLTAGTYLLNAVLVGPWLGETVSPARWFGTLLIAFGVVLVGLESEESPEKGES